LDGTLILNCAIFLYDYTGLQVTRIVNNTSLNENIDANIWGLEIETIWHPAAIPNMQINASYSYINTEVDGAASIDPVNRTADNPEWVLLNNLGPGSLTGTNFVALKSEVTPAVIAGCAALGATVPVPSISYPDGIPALWSRACLDAYGVTTNNGLDTNLDGNELPNTPEHNFVLGASYTWGLDSLAGELTLRWDYYWQSESYAREFNTRGDDIDSWDQHNASLIYRSNDQKWEAKVWVRNLQDEDNVTGKYLTSDTSGFYRNYFLTEPRIYGASFRYNFIGS
jgi:outer membrane receptor protein involved in Fe transport